MPKRSKLGRAALDSRLDHAVAAMALVRVTRARIEGRGEFSDGFVVARSARFVLLHAVGDGIDLAGYEALRIKHITELDDDFGSRDFHLRALALKCQTPTRPDAIDLVTTRSLLRSVDERYPLVVVNRERVNAGAREIGRVRALRGKHFRLHAITPNATWDVDDRWFRYADVTRVQFDGAYERSLALVSGAKPGMTFARR